MLQFFGINRKHLSPAAAVCGNNSKDIRSVTVDSIIVLAYFSLKGVRDKALLLSCVLQLQYVLHSV